MVDWWNVLGFFSSVGSVCQFFFLCQSNKKSWSWMNGVHLPQLLWKWGLNLNYNRVGFLRNFISVNQSQSRLCISVIVTMDTVYVGYGDNSLDYFTHSPLFASIVNYCRGRRPANCNFSIIKLALKSRFIGFAGKKWSSRCWPGPFAEGKGMRIENLCTCLTNQREHYQSAHAVQICLQA